MCDYSLHAVAARPADQPGGKFLGDVWGHVVLLGWDPRGFYPFYSGFGECGLCRRSLS